MKHSQGMTCRVAGIVVLTLLPILTVMADDKYVKSKEPVFPKVQPDRALVYFVRPGGTVQVQPGRRLLWGPMDDSTWCDFKAGKTYLLLLVERKVGRYEERALRPGDPADVRGLVTARNLAYVTPTEEGMAKLREEVAKEYEKVRKKAPEAITVTLPATFETVWYRPSKRGFSLKAYDAAGTLIVDKEKIEFRSDKKTLVIPVKDIQAVSLDKITSKFMSQFDLNEWGIVKYSSSGSTEVAAFRDGHKWGGGEDTERIYLTLRSVLQPTPVSSPPQSATTDTLAEEQLAVNLDQRKWRVGYETEKGGQRIKEFVLPEETVNNWTELVTIHSFLGAQERMTAEEVVLGMKQQLDECPKAMWRIIQRDADEFLYEWQTVDCPGWDNQYEVSKVIRGRTAIHRIAYANRKLPMSEETRRQWTDLIGQASSATLRSAVQSAAVSTPQQSEKATPVPEEFVVYEGFKDQFTIAIPQGWAAYDQEQVVFKKMPGLWGIVIFLPAAVAQELKESAGFQPVISESDVKELGRKGLELLIKADAGEIPSFMVERVRGDKGMSCSGFSEKAEKKLVQTIGRAPIFGKGRKVLEMPHADPTTVGGCKALRIRGRGQTSAGAESVVDVHAASDGETLYLFSLRPLAENYAQNLAVFEKAVSTAKFTAAK